MRMNAVVRAASAVLVTLALVPIVAGQPKAGPDGSDYVPPEKQREKSQANVSEMLERLLAVMEVADKITSKFDGKPGEGSQRGVVNLFMSRTTLEAFPPLQGECERLRWSLVRTRNERALQAGRIQIDISKAQREIDLQAEKIIKLEDAKDLKPDDAEAARRSASDLKAELAEKLKFREELATQASALSSRAGECDRELKELTVLQEHLDSLVRVELIRVDRNLAAVEYQSLARTPEDVDKRRQAIAEAIKVLGTKRKAGQVPHPVEVIPGVKSAPFENTKLEAKDVEQSELMRKTLEDARKRAGSGAAGSTPAKPK